MSVIDEFDLQDEALVADPYPVFSELRKPKKLLWSDRLELWLAPTYELANATLRARTLGRIYQDKLPQDEWEVFNWLHSDSILDSEPPKHTRLRRQVANGKWRIGWLIDQTRSRRCCPRTWL